MNQSVALTFYGNNIPFTVAETTSFKVKDMIRKFRPSYTPPNHKNLSGYLLDDAYERLQDKMVDLLSNKEVLVISQDGWTNTSQDPIIAHSLHDGRKSYLLNIEDCGSSEKSGEYCFDKAKEQIINVQDKYGKPVFGCVTDNEAKMKKMKELLEIDFPAILTWGCAAHHVNLIIPLIITNNIRSQIVHVNKFFRNHQQIHGQLMEMGGVQPKLSMEVRRNSFQELYSSFVTNIPKYRAIRTANYGNNLIDSVTASKIDNIGLEIEARHELEILTKLSVSLDKLQSDTCG